MILFSSFRALARDQRNRHISDRITARRGGTRGPFLLWLRSPELCEKVEALGAFCRFESSLDPRVRELSPLIAARHFDAQYSWNARIAKAAELGVSREALTELAESKEPQFTKRDEQLGYQFSAEILRDHFVTDATFAAALGERIRAPLHAARHVGTQAGGDLRVESGSLPARPALAAPARRAPDRRPAFIGAGPYAKARERGVKLKRCSGPARTG